MHKFMQVENENDTGHGDPPPKPPKREVPTEKDPVDKPADTQ